MQDTWIIVCSLLGLILSLLVTPISIIALVKVLALSYSTHSVQYIPKDFQVNLPESSPHAQVFKRSIETDEELKKAQAKLEEEISQYAPTYNSENILL